MRTRENENERERMRTRERERVRENENERERKRERCVSNVYVCPKIVILEKRVPLFASDLILIKFKGE